MERTQTVFLLQYKNLTSSDLEKITSFFSTFIANFRKNKKTVVTLKSCEIFFTSVSQNEIEQIKAQLNSILGRTEDYELC